MKIALSPYSIVKYVVFATAASYYCDSYALLSDRCRTEQDTSITTSRRMEERESSAAVLSSCRISFGTVETSGDQHTLICGGIIIPFTVFVRRWASDSFLASGNKLAALFPSKHPVRGQPDLTRRTSSRSIAPSSLFTLFSLS